MPRGVRREGDQIYDVPPERRCTETSESTGERCGAWAMKGHSVCYFHSRENTGRSKRPTVDPAALLLPDPTKPRDPYDMSHAVAARAQRERDLRRPETPPPPGFVWERAYEDPDHPWTTGPKKILDEHGHVFRWSLISFDRMVEMTLHDRVVADGERRDREAEARNDVDRRLYHRHLMRTEDPRSLPLDYRAISIPGLDPVPVDLDSDKADAFVAEVVRQAIRG